MGEKLSYRYKLQYLVCMHSLINKQYPNTNTHFVDFHFCLTCQTFSILITLCFEADSQIFHSNTTQVKPLFLSSQHCKVLPKLLEKLLSVNVLGKRIL